MWVDLVDMTVGVTRFFYCHNNFDTLVDEPQNDVVTIFIFSMVLRMTENYRCNSKLVSSRFASFALQAVCQKCNNVPKEHRRK